MICFSLVTMTLEECPVCVCVYVCVCYHIVKNPYLLSVFVWTMSQQDYEPLFLLPKTIRSVTLILSCQISIWPQNPKELIILQSVSAHLLPFFPATSQGYSFIQHIKNHFKA